MLKPFHLAVALALSFPIILDAQEKKETPQFDGAWKVTRPNQADAANPQVLTLKQEGEKLTGTLKARAETPIAEGKVSGGTITFKVTRDYQGKPRTSTFEGELDGETLKLTQSWEVDGNTRRRRLEGTRMKDEPAKVAGTWNSSFSVGERTIESTLKLKQEGEKLSGAMTFGQQQDSETPIKDAALKGRELSFHTTRERDGRTITTRYKGTLAEDGQKFTGKITSDWSGEERTFDWTATREEE